MREKGALLMLTIFAVAGNGKSLHVMVDGTLQFLSNNTKKGSRSRKTTHSFISVVKVLHERAQRHAIVRGKLPPLDLLLARAGGGRVVPVKGSGVHDQPVVGEQVAAVLSTGDMFVEQGPVFFELVLLLLEKAWSR